MLYELDIVWNYNKTGNVRIT